MLNYVINEDWKWSTCALPIKRSLKKEENEIVYQMINSNDYDDERVKITIEKDFPFEQETGFVWHKSWNLPKININLNEEEFTVFSTDYPKIGCEIMGVYPIKYESMYYLNQISLNGNTNMVFSESTVTYKFLKFAETSFSHNRNKFCLLLWIYGENSLKSKDDLFCFLSSPIYVDSRKEARKKQLPTLSLLKSLERPKKFYAPIKIGRKSPANSPTEFLSYYRAQNIRNKIKHPFYICYHFNTVFQLYLNKSAGVTNLVEVLRTIDGTSQKKHEDNLVLITISGQKIEYMNIISLISKWKFQSIDYRYKFEPLNQSWIPVSKEDIKIAYKMYYEQESIKQEKLYQDQVDSEEDLDDRLPKKYELRTVINLSNPLRPVNQKRQ